ncbi:MAG: 6-bladed beta-propeller [Candidatus Aminicenantes bacterium]|jgi:outer membrane protein assembly factor BamB|nr:6-bladed beta-propeller [Candidatus Aminicenantes bacterium]
MRIFVLPVVFLLLWPLAGFCQNSVVKELSPIMALDDLVPALQVFKNAIFNSAIVAINDGILFALDTDTHRVLKYRRDGSYLGQIGEIGKEESSLFYPCSMRIRGNLIFVLDHFGNKIKSFGIDGSFKQATNIDLGLKTKGFSFDITDNSIYANAFKEGDAFFNRNLIAQLDSKGNRVGGIGRLLPSERFVELVNANKVYFECFQGLIYGCFKNSPIIFIYDLDGREVLFRDLSDSAIPEIDNIKKEEAKNLERMKQEDPRTVALVNYFYSFSISKNLMYCGLNSNGAKKGTLLEFDLAGKHIRTIELHREGSPVMVLKTAVADDGDVFVVFRQNNRNYLAKLH